LCRRKTDSKSFKRFKSLKWFKSSDLPIIYAKPARLSRPKYESRA
jgi:hypothetical protein